MCLPVILNSHPVWLWQLKWQPNYHHRAVIVTPKSSTWKAQHNTYNNNKYRRRLFGSELCKFLVPEVGQVRVTMLNSWLCRKLVTTCRLLALVRHIMNLMVNIVSSYRCRVMRWMKAVTALVLCAWSVAVVLVVQVTGPVRQVHWCRQTGPAE